MVNEESFKKHYVLLVKKVSEHGDTIKELQRVIMELQVDIAKLKDEKVKIGMSEDDQKQFDRVFGDQEKLKI